MPDDHNVSHLDTSMETVCTFCSMRSACRDHANHRTRNLLQNLIAMQKYLKTSDLVVQVFPCDSKIGVQRHYTLPLDCPRTLRYGALEMRLHDIFRHRDQNVFYAIANTPSRLHDLYAMVGTDGWEIAETVPFLTEV